MSKKDEAMKLALEALEYIYEGANKQGPHTGISWRCVSKKAEPVITALREALAQQPEQESVAWRIAALRVGDALCLDGPVGYYDMTAEQWLVWALSVVTVHAPPAQRKPLTDEQIVAKALHLSGLGTSPDVIQFARAIEAAHGIKENT